MTGRRDACAASEDSQPATRVFNSTSTSSRLLICPPRQSRNVGTIQLSVIASTKTGANVRPKSREDVLALEAISPPSRVCLSTSDLKLACKYSNRPSHAKPRAMANSGSAPRTTLAFGKAVFVAGKTSGKREAPPVKSTVSGNVPPRFSTVSFSA